MNKIKALAVIAIGTMVFTSVFADQQFKAWTAADSESDKEIQYAMTTSTNNKDWGLSYFCHGDNEGMTLFLKGADFMIDEGESIWLNAQVDSGEVEAIRFTKFGESTEMLETNFSGIGDNLFEEMLQGNSIKIEVEWVHGGRVYPVFSLLGLTKSIIATNDKCNAISNKGFVKPTTKAEYDKIVDEGFVY